MIGLQRGSFRLFRLAGVEVFLHWSWFIVAVVAVQQRREDYSSLVWNVAEYLALFLIVLMHEFGHALACRQVGGRADLIILWPLGGVAFGTPPPRPGPTLWTIAAGPLVNVILLPIALTAALANQWMGWGAAGPDWQGFLWAMVYINGGLLIFNLLPIYPLDGGQMLRALLWFFVGRVRSLMMATTIGLAGAVGLVVLALYAGSIWGGVMVLFLANACWRSWQQARALWQLEKLPRRAEFACPVCRAAPPVGAFWKCHLCGAPFDTFATGAACPGCQARFGATACLYCGESRSMTEWMPSAAVPPEMPKV